MQVHIQRELGFSADKVWALLADFGNLCWAPGIQKVEVEGSGPGMLRKIHMGEGGSIDERLESVDPNRMTLEYTIPANNPMPVTDYRSNVTVTDLGEGRCRVDWRGQAREQGISAEQAEEILGGAYNAMLDWITDYLKG